MRLKVVPIIIDTMAASIVIVSVYSETGSAIKTIVSTVLVGLYALINYSQGIQDSSNERRAS